MIYEVTLSQTDADLHEKIRMANKVDPFYVEILKKIQEDQLFQQQKEYKVDESGLLWSKDRLYVLDGGDIQSSTLIEFHRAPYSGHLGYQKMIFSIKRHFFYPNLKADIAMFIAKCQECQLNKVEHQHPSGLLQPLPTLEWKWEVISMDFITGLQKNKKQNESIFCYVSNIMSNYFNINVVLIKTQDHTLSVKQCIFYL